MILHILWKSATKASFFWPANRWLSLANKSVSSSEFATNVNTFGVSKTQEETSHRKHSLGISHSQGSKREYWKLGHPFTKSKHFLAQVWKHNEVSMFCCSPTGCVYGGGITWERRKGSMAMIRVMPSQGGFTKPVLRRFSNPRLLIKEILTSWFLKTTHQKIQHRYQELPFFSGSYLFQTIILGIHVSFRGCMENVTSWPSCFHLMSRISTVLNTQNFWLNCQFNW